MPNTQCINIAKSTHRGLRRLKGILGDLAENKDKNKSFTFDEVICELLTKAGFKTEELMKPFEKNEQIGDENDADTNS